MPVKSIEDLKFLKRLDDSSSVFFYEYDNFLYVNFSAPENRTNFRDATLMTPKDMVGNPLIYAIEKNNLTEEIFNQLDGQYMVEYLLWKMEI